MNRKTVYILGAGSSIGHSKKIYPDINNIFKKANEYNIVSRNHKSILNKYKELNEYLKETFNYDLLSNKELDFEEVFTIIDIEEEKNPTDYGKLKLQLMNILCELFTKLKDSIKYNDSLDYYLFESKLRDYDSILTFNWDVLLDDVLGREYFLRDPLDVDNQGKKKRRKLSGHHHYKYLLESIHNDFYRHHYTPETFTGVYIKLHGSVDWNICKNPLCPFLNHPMPILYPLKNIKCFHCFEICTKLIIPPTLKKSINDVPFIRNQWNIAKEVILNASKIVIWGYNLPPTDFYSEWLLMKSKKNKSLKEIILINPNRDHRKNFKELFNKIGMDVQYSEYNYFKEYINNKLFKSNESLNPV